MARAACVLYKCATMSLQHVAGSSHSSGMNEIGEVRLASSWLW